MTMRDQLLHLSESRAGLEVATFAAGCFWHVEEAFRVVPGVVAIQVGYAGGPSGVVAEGTPCRRDTGHVEAARVWYDPSIVSFDDLLEVFWSCHDPATRHRVEGGSDYRYRSVIFVETVWQQRRAEASIVRERERRLKALGAGSEVTTRTELGAPFQVADASNQQRLQRRAAREAAKHDTERVA
jgi:peptide-methionine (S)-S-oxide reductase